ncbi:MAG: phospholipid-binding protein MlaC [Neisseriaceae bacterium]
MKKVTFGILLSLFSLVVTAQESKIAQKSPSQITTVSYSKSNASAVSSGINKKAKTTNVTTDVDDCDVNSPCFIVKDTSEQVLSAINNGASQKQTMNLIKNVVTPQFNFLLMTKYALGNNWKLATGEQQEKLVENFQKLLIYTYSSALSKFKGAKINITSQNVSEKKSVVISQVVLPNYSSDQSQPIRVEYDLARLSADKPWKAYDIKIENASLVTTYRNQFNEIVQTKKIDGLIKQLESKVVSLQKVKAH